jgi:hypothetical protein
MNVSVSYRFSGQANYPKRQSHIGLTAGFEV